MAYLPHVTSTQLLRKAADICIKALEPIKDKFGSIAVRGVSGITVGTIVALEMEKGLVIIRKPHEQSHSGMIVGALGWKDNPVVWLDDFIATGDTYRAIIEGLGRIPDYSVFHGSNVQGAGNLMQTNPDCTWTKMPDHCLERVYTNHEHLYRPMKASDGSNLAPTPREPITKIIP